MAIPEMFMGAMATEAGRVIVKGVAKDGDQLTYRQALPIEIETEKRLIKARAEAQRAKEIESLSWVGGAIVGAGVHALRRR